MLSFLACSYFLQERQEARSECHRLVFITDLVHVVVVQRLALCALHLLFNERLYFFKDETDLTGAVPDACELCGARTAVEYGFSRAADYFSHSFSVDACLLVDQTHLVDLLSGA